MEGEGVPRPRSGPSRVSPACNPAPRLGRLASSIVCVRMVWKKPRPQHDTGAHMKRAPRLLRAKVDAPKSDE